MVVALLCKITNEAMNEWDFHVSRTSMKLCLEFRRHFRNLITTNLVRWRKNLHNTVLFWPRRIRFICYSAAILSNAFLRCHLYVLLASSTNQSAKTVNRIVFFIWVKSGISLRIWRMLAMFDSSSLLFVMRTR